MAEILDINKIVKQLSDYLIVDVRTPAEYEKGHIANAINIPLFSNDERVIVGTIYKQQGREKAILKGLEMAGPKMAQLILELNNLSSSKAILVHCWRGGMRSGSVGWLYKTYGFKTFTLKGGYKLFRRKVLSILNQPYHFNVLGGKTGSGKTQLLYELKQKGNQIIDLENIANHKGSAFGALGEIGKVTQEQFENNLALQLEQLDMSKPIWIEDESRTIGSKVIPQNIWDLMRGANVYFIDISIEKRIENLLKDYGSFTKQQLIDSFQKIGKRLGGKDLKDAILAIENNDLVVACEIGLRYYDKAYLHCLSKRNPEKIIKSEDLNDFLRSANLL